MKTNFTFYRYAILFILLFVSLCSYGQRNYATSQRTGTSGLLCLNCIVTNPANAADGNLQSYSVLNVTVGLAAQTYQELIFPSATKVAGGTPVTVKLGTGNNLLDIAALGSISLQAYNGNTAVDQPVSAATLLTAASSNNQIETSIIPSQTYDRLRVTLNGGLLGALSSIYLYDAFYNGTGAVACNSAFDELHGISSAILNLGVDIGGVANPQLAIDGDINTASTLNAGVGALGAYAQQTIIYQSLSVVGDSVRLTLGIPQALIDAGVLTNISLSTYNGNVSNNDTQILSSALLSVRLLDLNGTRRKVVVTYVPAKIFDRVQLRLGNSIANVLSTLNLYEVQKLIPKPIIKYNTVVTTDVQICTGNSVTLTATAIPNTVFNWYTQATGGSPVFTGTSFTTPALSTTTTYYVAAARSGCTDESDRTPVTVTVNGVPVAPVIANNAVTICPGQQATFTAQAVTGVTINWYSVAAGGTPVATGNSFTTPALTQNTTYYAEAISGGTCISAGRTQVTATISTLPASPTLASSAVTICSGDVAVLSIAAPVTGQTYNWYATATGGTPLYTGTTFTTPALTQSTNYYAEAVNATGCASLQRAQATVTVQPKPANPVLAANNLTISAGQTATINVSNAQTDNTYNWYTSATAATPIYTGSTYQTPALYTTTTYYVEAVNAAGCVSASRTAVTITVTMGNSAACTFAATQSSNVNGICVACSVTNNALAVDADTTTASTINVTAGLLGGYAEQQLVFQQPGFAGDTIKLGLRTPVSLADVALLGQIQVTFYNGTTQGARYTLDNSLIKLQLLGVGNRYNVYVPATGNYDRITIRLTSGAATLLTSLQVYYATQQFATPVVSPAVPQICKGGTAQLSITSPTNGTFNWYTVPVGGTPVLTGANVTTPALTANTTYYVEYTRGTCTGAVRYPVTILVNDAPVKLVVNPASATINSGQTATFTADVANNVTVKWYNTATAGTVLYTGKTFTTPALSANGDYYAESSIGSCTSPDRTHVTVTVNPVTNPDVTVTPPTQSVGAGGTATFTATSTTPGAVFNWYTTPVGGTSIFTGPVFNTPPVFAGTTYYAEASVPSTGAVSTTRAPGVVTVDQTAASPTPCDAAIAETNSNSGVLCVGCGIANAGNAVDNDRNTASQLTVIAGIVDAYQQQTLRFASTGRAGDSVIVELGVPGSLAAVGVLSQISLATYNGTTYNNDRFSVNGSLLSISLLNGASRFRVAFKAQSDFDRVEIRLNSSVAGLLNSLNIYDASQEVSAPVITNANITACQGSQATLTATVPDYVTVKWYTSPTGGTAVFTGSVFNTPALTATTTYYAEASRTADGCAQLARTPATVTVTPAPATPVVNTPTVTVCSGQPATFTAQAVNGVTFSWYAQATGGTPVFTGNPFTTPALTVNTTYYAEANSGSQCSSSTRTAVTANVTATPVVPVISQTPVQTCSGSSAVLTATSAQSDVTFNWYTTATGGTPVFTGPQYTTPALTANTSYYAEAVLGTCTSPTRAEGDVTVNPVPVAPSVVINPSTAQIPFGQTATLTATSVTAGSNFNWYTTANGGTPVFTGNPFVTPALTSNITYYAESVLSTGCISPTRTAVNLEVSSIISTSCDFANSQTVDVNGGIACVNCLVTTPNAAVDADTTSSSQLNLPIAIGGSYIAQKLIFGDNGNVGDSVAIKITIPASLLATGVGNQIQIASYNGTTYNNDRVNLNSTTLNVRILADSHTAIIKFAPSATFNAVEVRLNSALASLFNSLNIYYASKQVEAPRLAANSSVVNICANNSAVFTVANARAGVTYNWYTTPMGGTPVFTGATFNTGPLTSTTVYYVESSRTSSGCANPNRVAATANVTPAPVTPVLAQSSFQVCSGTPVTFTVTNAGSTTINWYDAATNGNLLFTGASFTVTPVTNATYYAEAANGTCTSTARTAGTVQITATPAQAGVQASSIQVCTGSTATITVISPESGVTYSLYNVLTGGTALATGTTLTTPAVNANTTYYVGAANAAGCTSAAGRTTVNVTVTNQASAPVLSAMQTQICNGGSVSISVVNPVAGVTYNWYATATATTPIFTGNTYTVDNVTANASYFVEATNGTTCAASARTETDITVIPIPLSPQVQVSGGSSSGNSVCTASVAVLSIVNPQANQVYRWYSAAIGGTLLFTGTQFTTPPLTASTTYFVETTTAGNCNPSARTAVTVTVNALPADPVLTATNVSVCIGASATLSISSPQSGVTYNWYDSPARTNLLGSGATFITGPITATTNFYASASNASGCVSNNLAQAQVTVQAAPGAPLVSNGTVVTACSGTQVTLSISNPQSGYTYNWYAAASGGGVISSGVNFVTPVLSANTTYYAEAVNSNGCNSLTRTAVSITVNQTPAAPVISNAGTSVCPGTAATLTATADAGATISWFAAATGGTALFTGPSFTTPALSANTTYYAEAASAAGCTSVVRTAVTVRVLQALSAPVVTVGATTATSVTFTWNTVAGATGYQVSFDNGQTFSTPSGGANSTSQTVDNLKPAVPVSIIVRAVGNLPCELSANSAAVTGTSANPQGNSIFVPNAFTPNGDGNNDIFYVYGTTIKSMNMYIYDQWGELIFKANSQAAGWDGTYKGSREPVGTYVYLLDAVLNDGSKITKKGTVTIIR